MTKKMESSGNSGAIEKQVDLTGRTIEQEKMSDSEELGIWKSVLQKAVRRGMTEKAMYAVYRLVSLNWWSCWRRISVIADEDVGQPDAIVAVDVLYRKFLAMKGGTEKGELSWDAKRCVLCAAKILSEAPKDRRGDEFLELMEAIEKHGKDEQLQKIKTELEAIPDEALDMHTLQGRRMGRGDLYWYEVSSETVNKTPEYEAWREQFFKPLMLQLTKKKGREKNEA
jgi:replication-associated recombination protein RarA